MGESEPLLHSGSPPTYDSIVQTRVRNELQTSSYEVTFDSSLPRRTPVIECRVCHATVDCSGRLHQHVIRCNTCNEATPLKPPPDGKKYIRCNCNCLLVCSEGAVTVACPRCRRHISMRRQVIPTAPRSAQLECPVCRSEFSSPFPLEGSTHCPSCDTKLLLNRKTRNKRVFISFWLFLAFFAAGVICMICAFALRGKKISPDDPIAWVMFLFYAFSIIVMFVGLVTAIRSKVATLIEYNHTF